MRAPPAMDAVRCGIFTPFAWIKVTLITRNHVQQALGEPDSILHYYQELIRLRKKYPVIIYGAYDLIMPEHEQIYAFTRTLEDERLLVVLNFSQDTPLFSLPAELRFEKSELLISNYAVDARENIDRFHLRPYEARVNRLG